MSAESCLRSECRHSSCIAPVIAGSMSEAAVTWHKRPPTRNSSSSPETTISSAVVIQIRAGLHTGEIDLIELGIAGIAVHVAARVESLAGPDEVLVSSTVRDLVAGSGFSFSDRGRHELKGVPGTWQVMRVEQPGR